MPEISVVDIKKFLEFGSNRPIQMTEMQTFWKALTDAEKQDYRNAVLKWDKQTFFC